MKFQSTIRRLRNMQGGMGSTARSASTPYYEPPVARAGSDQIVAVGTKVSFDGSDSTGSNLTYSWAFGDGANPTTGTGVMPSCTYSTTGAKTVSLTVIDDRGVESSDTVTITVHNPPVADAGSNQTVLVDKTVSFNGSGSYDPDGGDLTYSWAFGDGATPTTASTVTPSCTYSTIGAKTVTLTVTDDEEVSRSDTVTITVHNAPIANAGSNQTVLVGDTVNFDGSGSYDPDGGDLTYSWAFGDGATPTTASTVTPSCTYSTIGAKTVTLTVTDDEEVSRSDTVTITVHSPPVADAGSDQTVAVDTEVSFDGLGSNDPDGGNLTYSWDFGTDATPATGTGVTPSCTYSTIGTKTVTLTVTDDNGATASDTVTINVHNPPVADAGSNQTVLVGTEVSFDGSGSTGSGRLFYLWNFGDDEVDFTTSFGVRTSCTYNTPGAKTVTLTVYDIATGLTDSDTVTITVHNPPIADAGSDQIVLVDDTVNFDGSGSNDPDGGNLTYSWDFGTDATPATASTVTTSCTYSTTGAKTVSLTVTDDNGATASDTVTINVHDKPVAVAGSDQIVLVNETVNFDGSGSIGNNLSYSWDFGAGATPATGTGVTLSCTYSTTGAKTVTLTVTDDNGATASDTVTITVHNPPVADAGSNQTVAVGSEVTFDGSGSTDPDGGNLTYSWDFGADATPATSNGEMPFCIYSTPGTKIVTLTVTDDEGATASDTVTITVHNVLIADAGSDQTVLVDDTVNFDGSVSNAPDGANLTYSWDFGADATPATGTGVMRSCTYSTTGAKTVTLTVSYTADGEKVEASDTVTITVHNAPIADAGSNQTVAVGTEVSFDGSGSSDPDGGNLTYSWDFGVGADPATSNGERPFCIYSTTGAKTVTLTVTDDEGATASDTVTITVHNTPIADAGSDQDMAVGTEVSFDGSGSSDPDGGNLTYSWDFGAGADPPTSNAERPFCIYRKPGTKIVRLTVTDDEGATASDTATINVSSTDVFAPVADAGSDQTVAVGETVSFDGSGSIGNNLSYLWDFDDEMNPTASSNEMMASYAYITTGAKTVRLTVTDDRRVENMATLTVTSIEPAGPRAASHIEAQALKFTFGEDVGRFLIGRIKIEFPDGLTSARVPDKVDGKRNVSTIYLPGNYNDQDVAALGIFIHEATHIWQRNTLLYREEGDYQYTLSQLHSLNFNKEEHAWAVQNWFVANYAYTHGLIGDGPGQVSAVYAWTVPLHQILGIHPDFFDENPEDDIVESARIWLINVYYERLINQIRDSTRLPPLTTKLGQNIPNPVD